MKINLDGINLNYELNGTGPCLVLIHGLTDNLSMWFNQVPELSKKFQVVTYDLRGHGQSETPGNGFSIDLLTKDLYKLLKALNIENACLLGYSLGGRIGLQFALEHPDMTTGLVLTNIGLIGPDYQAGEERLKLIAKHRQFMISLFESSDIEMIANVLAEGALTPGLKTKNPSIFEKYRDIKLQNNPQPYLELMQAITQDLERLPEIGHLNIPTLIVAGKHDPMMTPDVVESMQKAFSDSALKILPTGHASAVEAPDHFNQIVIDFMKRFAAIN